MERAYRLDLQTLDSNGNPLTVRSYINRLDNGKVVIHWPNQKHEIVLPSWKPDLKAVCRSLLTASCIRQISAVDSLDVWFDLYDFRSLAQPMSSCMTEVCLDDIESGLDRLAVQMTAMVTLYRCIDFDTEALQADRRNSALSVLGSSDG